jgi:DNA-directed RNA polymerase specialized sigma subunit
MTQTQVAVRIGISQMHVSRLIRKSIESLRLYMEEEESHTDGARERGEDR